MQSFAGNLQSPQLPNLPQQQGFGAFLGQMPGVQQWGSLGENMLPQAQQAFNQSFYNPYAMQGLQGGLDAAAMGGQAANNQFNIGGNLAGGGNQLFGAAGGLPYPAYNTIGAGQSLFGPGSQAIGAGANILPYAQPILNQAFDPQNALYQRTAQQVQDQTRAAESARGIATSPYGAGLESQAMSNFNIDWQNNLLNRMATGAGAAGGLTGAGVGAMGTGAGIYGQGGGLEGAGAGLLGTMGNLYGQGGQLGATGAGLMSGAPQGLYSTSMLPYATWSGIGSGQNQALMNLLGYGQGAQGLNQTSAADWLSLMGAGNQQASTQNQAFANQLQQSNMGWNQLGQLGSGLGSLAGKLGPMLPSFGAGGGGLGGTLMAGAML